MVNFIYKFSLCILLFLHYSSQLSAQDFINNVIRETKKGINNTGKVLGKAGNDASNTMGIALHDIGMATGQAAQDARRTIEKGLQDASRNAGKGAVDLIAETGRIGKNAEKTGIAIKNYVGSSIPGYISSIQDAEKRIADGKLLDAAFHLALDPLTAQEEAAFQATQESGWLNTVGATAAAAYGGPAGAAAYATWQTYKATNGNAELAIRAGIITGLTSSAMSGIGTLNGTTTTEMVRKSVLAGAVGGLAIAASGGDADEIRNGFILGGGIVLVQDAYRNFVGHKLYPEGATGEPYCTSPGPSCSELKSFYSLDENGDPQLDTYKMNPHASFVGIAADPNNPLPPGSPIPIGSDQSVLMRTVAKIPGMNAMGLFHDKWVVSWNMSSTFNKLTIFPAILLTYYGTGAPLSVNIAETVSSQSQLASGNISNPESKDPTFTQSYRPVNFSFLSNNGTVYIATETGVYTKYGMKINEPSILFEALRYAEYLESNKSKVAPPVLANDVFKESDLKNIPNGFNGNATDYKELMPIELAGKGLKHTGVQNVPYEPNNTIMHSTAPEKSILFIRNIANGKMARVFVVGKPSSEDIRLGITMRLSQKVCTQLGIIGDRAWIESEYENISIARDTFYTNASVSDRTVKFLNLQNGKWTLAINSFVSVNDIVYLNMDYKNEFIIKPTQLPGRYSFVLYDNSEGQFYRPFEGWFNVY